jgi:hypothetical protein
MLMKSICTEPFDRFIIIMGQLLINSSCDLKQLKLQTLNMFLILRKIMEDTNIFCLSHCSILYILICFALRLCIVGTENKKLSKLHLYEVSKFVFVCFIDISICTGLMIFWVSIMGSKSVNPKLFVLNDQNRIEISSCPTKVNQDSNNWIQLI